MIKSFKLFENPNYLNDDFFRSFKNYAFGYYGGKLRVEEEVTHHELYNKYEEDAFSTGYREDREYFRTKLSGRLFPDEKLISFWKFPKNNFEFKKLVKQIEKKLKIEIWDDSEYKIEISMDESGWEKSHYAKSKYIPLKDYIGSKERSEVELSTQHTLSPLKKPKRKIYQKKPTPLAQKQKMYAESFENMITKFKLFEEDSYEGVKKFTIPKELRKNTKISNRNLAFVRDWKTKIIVCNSCAEGNNVGDWDDVGYTMVNHKTNEIIPIARADEHHTGYDLMWEYQEQGKIKNVNDWVAIFFGNNYMFSQPNKKDSIKKAKAFEKWLSYGGKNTNLMVTIEKAQWQQEQVELDLQTFVDLKGNIDDLKRFIETDGELTQDAKNFIDYLGYTIFHFDRYRKGEETAQKVCNFVKYFIKQYFKIKNLTFLDNARKFKIDIEKASNKCDIDELERIILSHNGLKNTIHNMLRHNQDNPELKKYFGNVKVALNKFNILSNI